MKITPDKKYENLPCSQVAAGCAYEDIHDRKLSGTVAIKLKNAEGYATLKEVNKVVRAVLPVSKQKYFPRSERITLKEFLATNNKKCTVCVLGHYIYVNNQDYYSFFENEDDPVVCVWYLNAELVEKRKTVKKGEES